MYLAHQSVKLTLLALCKPFEICQILLNCVNLRFLGIGQIRELWQKLNDKACLRVRIILVHQLADESEDRLAVDVSQHGDFVECVR